MLVHLLPNHKVIGWRWVYKLKLKSDGSIKRHKAWLVAKGFHQTKCLNYFETFNPVVKLTVIFIVLILVLSHGWPLKQLDVHNSFLNWEIDEVYMEQPPGFVDPFAPHLVCKLSKALYGLK